MEDKAYGQSYAMPELKEDFVDVEKGHVIDKKDIPPLEVIKMLAKRQNVKISDPYDGCRKCNGRGYTHFDKDGVPAMCQCLFRHMTPKERMANAKATPMPQKLNRAQRRKMQKQIHKRVKAVAPSMVKEREPVELKELPSQKKIDIFPVQEKAEQNG